MLDWLLRIGNNADRIIANIWLGNLTASHDRAFIEKHGIRVIINCTKDLPFADFCVDMNIKMHRLPVYDRREARELATMEAHIDAMVDILRDCHRRRLPVLVHCFAGAQRSATVVACFLKWLKPDTTLDQVIAFMRMRRRAAFWRGATFQTVLERYFGNACMSC